MFAPRPDRASNAPSPIPKVLWIPSGSLLDLSADTAAARALPPSKPPERTTVSRARGSAVR